MQVLVLSSDANVITLSTKVLEAAPGDMLWDRQAVWDRAEDMAQRYRDQASHGFKVGVVGSGGGGEVGGVEVQYGHVLIQYCLWQLFQHEMGTQVCIWHLLSTDYDTPCLVCGPRRATWSVAWSRM